MEFGRESWRSFERGIEREWLLANGIGGYASTTIIGANTRRYHGLLIASLNPPVERHLILSKINETVIIDNDSYNLSTFATPDYIEKGFQYQQHFSYSPLPVYTYSIGDIFIKKKITTVYGENTIAIIYQVFSGSHNLKLKLIPLVNFRNHHYNSNRNHMEFTAKKIPLGIEVKPYFANIPIRVICSQADFTVYDNCWFFNMLYPMEQERGLDALDDHYIPGCFLLDFSAGEEKTITVIASIEKEVKEKNGFLLIKKEEKRISDLLELAGFEDEFAKRLTVAADKFIVHRKSTDSKSIIAGYPWFTDWGRDTMIALPGIALVAKRFKDAKEILFTFSQYIKNGLLPNMFVDGSHPPAYNTVDASLWFFEAVNKYLKYTNDYSFIREHIYKGLEDIIQAYIHGTCHDIKMDKDCLISAGNPSTQLTWMDAKVEGMAVTPRYGKVVEINALWYNALVAISNLADIYETKVTCYKEMGKKVKVNFARKFWNEAGQCLYDVVGKDFKDDRVRPNQIIAVSLSNGIIEGTKAKKIVLKVWKDLYTDFGLRTLSQESNEYKGIIKGDQRSRDSAYHQGTSWVWLLGHFITAYRKVFGNGSLHKDIVCRFIEPFKTHLKDGCLGSISEIFDGDEPHFPRGCIAQGWSVGEILRAYVEDILRIY